MSVKFMASITVVLMAMSLAACQSEEDFTDCPLNDKMLTDCNNAIPIGEDQCSGTESFCGASCIVSDHPYCGHGPCILYKNRDVATVQDWKSTPFCGMGCTTTLDCPAASTCKAVPALKFECTTDEGCKDHSPWAVCEADGFCTWNICIPDRFGDSTTE